MKAVARAHANRNLGEFRAALRDYKEGLYPPNRVQER